VIDLKPAKVVSMGRKEQQQPARTHARSENRTSLRRPRTELALNKLEHHYTNRSDGSMSSRPSFDENMQHQLVRRCLSHNGELRGRNAGNEDGRSLGDNSDENVPPERARRPKSAWNSRSGRRPQFTFSDEDATGGSGNECRDEVPRKPVAARRKSTNGDLATVTQERATQRRASQIPVRMDRLHPATTKDVPWIITASTRGNHKRLHLRPN